MKDILSVDQFDRVLLDQILIRAEEMRRVANRHYDRRLSGKILATLFFEPSTRTRLSFESAMLRLGGEIISSEMATETSSAAKGETIEDTIRIVESYADAIVIRHPEAGSAGRAAAVASVPIINGGDGPGEHPTQALLDIFTIHREMGRIDDLTVALVGDLRYGRAPRSLARLLTRTRSCRLILVSPPELGLREDVIGSLRDAAMPVELVTDLDDVVSEADVIYVTRVQRERFPDQASFDAVSGAYRFGPDHLKRMRDHAIVMHPLPRVDEIDPQVDSDARAAYFRQAQNGVYVRMALLDMLLNPEVAAR